MNIDQYQEVINKYCSICNLSKGTTLRVILLNKCEYKMK
jgi:hypothetical protein